MKKVVLSGLLMAAWISGQGFVRPLVPGDPMPGVTPSEFELFLMGLDDFTEVESPEEGLGPAFNGTSCAGCHNVPAVGGSSTITEIRAGYRDADGEFHALGGDTLYHLFSIPNHLCQVRIPPEANVIARRASIPLFGAGLVEAIPDQTIAAKEDPGDLDNDGISGRAARIVDVATGQQRVGRFGWKAQQATLLAFSADAYRNEMGITNDLFPDEFALGVDPATMRLCSPPRRGLEDVRDRRTGLRGIDNFVNFLRVLAAVPRGPVDDTVRAGERLFEAAGCAACHTPVMMTGPDSNPLFDRKPVPLYSDLLLHDIGTGDGIQQAATEPDEIRTPALWGLRLRRPFLHDGSAPTPEAAILRHGREAAESARRFSDLHAGEREALLRFLASL